MEIIDNIICIEQQHYRTYIKIGSVLAGNKPAFVMHDAVWLEQFPAVKDEKVHDDAIDKRFFIENYPTQLYKLDKSIKEKIANLPPKSSIRSDGALLHIEIPSEINDGKYQEALDIAKALSAVGMEKLALFESVPGIQLQPRSQWDECPEPQFIIERDGVTIEGVVPWYTPITLKTPNVNRLPSGILSVKENRLVPYNEKSQALLEVIERIVDQEALSKLGPSISFYSSMNDNDLRFMLYHEPTSKMANAAVEVLARIALLRVPQSPAPIVEEPKSSRIIDDVISVEVIRDKTLVSMGFVVTGRGPRLEMRDETILDKLKKLFFLKEEKLYKNDELNDRFFVSGNAGFFWRLPENIRNEVYGRIAALPRGATIRMDGRIAEVEIPTIDEEATLNVIELVRALGNINQETFRLLENIPGILKQQRASWDVCPDPQFTLYERGILIEFSVSWSWLGIRVSNQRNIPSGIISWEQNKFMTKDNALLPLLERVKQITSTMDPRITLGSIYSVAGRNTVEITLHGRPTKERIQAAIEIISHLAAPVGDGPFR